jgi:hypothetical protein
LGVVLFLIDDRVPAEPREQAGWWNEVPWRAVGALGLILVLCIVGSVLAPAEGLACVLIAAVLACRLGTRLGDWRGMREHRQ